MDPLSFPGVGVIVAALFAGPIFLANWALGTYYADLPAAVPVDESMVMAPGLMVITMPFGFVIAIVPCFIGAVFMVAISDSPAMRSPLAWGVAGGLMPLVITLPMFWADWGAGSFALSATGAACALICRRYAV